MGCSKRETSQTADKAVVLLAQKRTQALVLVAILLLGFLFRLSYVGTSGFAVDLRLFVQWARLFVRDGLVATYEQMPSAYPPLGTLLLSPVGLMCPQCPIKAGPTGTELFVLRLLCTGFDMFTAAILFRIGRKARRPLAGLVASAFYSLFPVMPLVSGWWGQNDSWLIFFMLIACVLLEQGRSTLAWAFLGLTILVKLQAIVLLPVFLAGTWRWFGPKRLAWGGIVFALVLGLFCFPFLVKGHLDDLVLAITLPIRHDPFTQGSHITLGGYNVWMGAALLKQLDPWGSYRHTLIPGITFYAASMSLLTFSLALVAASVFINSSSRSVYTAMAATWIVFFQFAIGVGVRYQLPILALMLVGAIKHPSWWALCTGLHFATLLNLQYTIHDSGAIRLWIPFPGGIETSIVFNVVLSLLTLSLFFIQTGSLRLEGRLRASFLECLSACGGVVALVILLAMWLVQSANAQYPLEQAGTALGDNMHQEIGVPNTLVINWPNEISLNPLGVGPLPPATGFVELSLDDMGADSATTVIYFPWAEAVNEIHRWDASYHGYHVTKEMLVERILRSKRVVTANMLTSAPKVWRLADISDLAASPVPVACFDRYVRLMDGRVEYREQILFVQLDWNVAQPLDENITVFVHVVGPDGQLVTQIDGDTVNNLIPLGQWHIYPDQVLSETRMAVLPKDAPAGEYTAMVGLYDRTSLERLEVSCKNQACENHAYALGPIAIEPGSY